MKKLENQMSEKQNLNKIDPLKQNLIDIQCEIQYNGRIFNGVIEQETKNTLQIKTGNGIKVIPKQSSILIIDNNDYRYQIQGYKLVGRQEDRIKRKTKRKW